MKFRACKKASIYNLNHQFICDGETIELEDNLVKLEFYKAKELEDYIETKAYIVFYDNIYGCVTYLCHMKLDQKLKNKNSHYVVYDCKMLEQTSIVQRRKDYKISVFVTTKFLFDKPEGGYDTVEGRIFNMSAGGIFFSCKKQLQVGDKGYFVLDTGEQRLSLCCEILRVQPLTKEQCRFVKEDSANGYGCRFYGIGSKEETAIRSYVYQEDLKSHKKIERR